MISQVGTLPDQALRKAEGGLALGHLAEPVLSLGISSALGCAYGVLIGRLLAVPSRPFGVVLKRLPPGTASTLTSSVPAMACMRSAVCQPAACMMSAMSFIEGGVCKWSCTYAGGGQLVL